jgi:Arc/MetJ-type ribon-helix-helix transcriptional regulator
LRAILAHDEEKSMAIAEPTAKRRAHVVLPEAMVEEIDRLVGPRGRSEFIQDAIAAELQRRRRVAAFEAVAGTVKDGEIPEWDTSESSPNWVRSLREEWEAGDPWRADLPSPASVP